MNPADSADVELESLIALFYEHPERMGAIEMVPASEVPSPSRELLAHEHHMTVTVEDYHGCPVDVQVLQSRHDDHHYSRKILLIRRSDSNVVQFGIVRLNTALLADEVRLEIEAQQTPLGRILINHNVMRRVRLLGLCKVRVGEELASYFQIQPGEIVYGRTALIYCDGQPAIELLEVVSE